MSKGALWVAVLLGLAACQGEEVAAQSCTRGGRCHVQTLAGGYIGNTEQCADVPPSVAECEAMDDHGLFCCVPGVHWASTDVRRAY